MINKDSSAVASGSIAEMPQRVFCIQQTKEMMEILSKNMYSEPEIAVAREIMCNAYDANTSRAFEVTVPDGLEPYFIVRDFGEGLSDEDTQTLYTTYGASTKRMTNSQIGGFGIGSKSPFALTDSFEVTSIFKGVKRTYQCFKSKGLPYITKVSEAETTEESGLTVKVPIKDINKFISGFLSAIRGFNRADMTIKGSKENFKFFEDFYTPTFVEGLYKSEWTRPAVRMGKVLYHVPPGLVSRRNVVLDVPIGTFEVAASREELHMSEEVSENLTNLWREKQKEFEENFDKYIPKTITTFAERRYWKGIYDDLASANANWDDPRFLVMHRWYDSTRPSTVFYKQNRRGNYVTTRYEPDHKTCLWVRVPPTFKERYNLKALSAFADVRKYPCFALYTPFEKYKRDICKIAHIGKNYTDYLTILREYEQLAKTRERTAKALKKHNRSTPSPSKVHGMRDYYGNDVEDTKDLKCYVAIEDLSIVDKDRDLMMVGCNANLFTTSQIVRAYKKDLKTIKALGIPHISDIVTPQILDKVYETRERKQFDNLRNVYRVFCKKCQTSETLSKWLDCLYDCPYPMEFECQKFHKFEETLRKTTRVLRALREEYRWWWNDTPEKYQNLAHDVVLSEVKETLKQKGLDKYLPDVL